VLMWNLIEGLRMEVATNTGRRIRSVYATNTGRIDIYILM